MPGEHQAKNYKTEKTKVSTFARCYAAAAQGSFLQSLLPSRPSQVAGVCLDPPGDSNVSLELDRLPYVFLVCHCGGAGVKNAQTQQWTYVGSRCEADGLSTSDLVSLHTCSMAVSLPNDDMLIEKYDSAPERWRGDLFPKWSRIIASNVRDN